MKKSNNISVNKNENVAKVPPHSIEAEQAVLASVIIDANTIDELLTNLSIDDFYLNAHKLIYQALLNLHKSGKALDLVTLITQLSDEGNLEKSGGMDYVSELVRIIPNSANVLDYAKIIRDKSMLRQLISVGAQVSELGFSLSGEVSDIINEAQSIVFNLNEDDNSQDPIHIRDLIIKHNDKLSELYERSDFDKDISGVTSGFYDLDLITGGFQRSDMIIVAGRPGMGKTSFGLNVLYNAAAAGHTCVFFSLEMPSSAILNRIISSEAKIIFSKLKTGNLNIEEFQSVANCYSTLDKLDIFIEDSLCSVNEISAKCRKLKKRNGKLDMIFVDYLQFIEANKSIPVREQQIAEISRALKGLAKELDVPVMVFAQVNRAVESRSDNKTPMLSDLRESGAIEQDADLIMFLYRDEVYNKASLVPNTAQVIVAKHRNGETGDVFLSFDKHFTSFGKRPVSREELAKARAAMNQPKSSRKKGEAGASE